MSKLDVFDEKLNISKSIEKFDFISDDRFNPMNIVGVQHNKLVEMLMQKQTNSIEKNIQMAAQWYCKADGSFLNTLDKTFIEKLQLEGSKVFASLANSKASIYDFLEDLKISEYCKQELKWLLNQIIKSEGFENMVNRLEEGRTWEKRIMSTDWLPHERALLLSALSTVRYSSHYWLYEFKNEKDSDGAANLKAKPKKCKDTVRTVCYDAVGAIVGGITGTISSGNPIGGVVGAVVCGGAFSGASRLYK